MSSESEGEDIYITFILKSLLLIRPTAYSNIALDPHNTAGVEHGVALPDHGHDLVPGTLCNDRKFPEEEEGLMLVTFIESEREGEEDMAWDGMLHTESGAGGVHRVVDPGFGEEALDVGDF
jgi:hypothetical protein